jgi:hypothetical protein
MTGVVSRSATAHGRQQATSPTCPCYGKYHNRDAISATHLAGTQRNAAVPAKIRSANSSTPDQRRCSVACRLGLSQIDKLQQSSCGPAPRVPRTFVSWLITTVHSPLVRHVRRFQTDKSPSSSRSLAEASGRRTPSAHMRKERLTRRAALHRPLCPAGKEASLPSRPSARNHLHRFVCSCALGWCFVRALPGTCAKVDA